MSPRLFARFFAVFVVGATFWAPHASADILGQREAFFVNAGFDVTHRQGLDATLHRVSERAYWYLEDAAWNELSSVDRTRVSEALLALATEFDTRIYPITTATWGSEARPGVDGDPRVTILLHRLNQGAGGYFDTIHSYSVQQAQGTNAREMVVVNFDALLSRQSHIFLAHEFQHLISLNQKEFTSGISEDVWLNELRAEYTVSLMGYNTPFEGSSLESRVDTLKRFPTDSALVWVGARADYGQVALFAEYLVGRYGEGILRDTLHSNSSGTASLDAWLVSRGYRERFTDVITDWWIANMVNNAVADPRFGYTRLELANIRVQPSFVALARQDTEHVAVAEIESWEPVTHDFRVADVLASGESAVRITMNGDPRGVWKVRVVTESSDGVLRAYDVPIGNATATFVVEPGHDIERILLAGAHIGQQGNWEQSLVLQWEARMRTIPISEIGSSELVIPGTPTDLEGALVKRNNAETEMYVITRGYKRYLRPEIIALYGHLDPSKVIPLDGAAFDGYQTASYIRVDGDQKVYAVWPDGTKHWLRMSGAQFGASGRDWNAIFTVSTAEAAAYKTGADITQ
ncbi:MAG: hypothetical protein AAB463_00665 [Patescibacteria group bacterium]